MTGATGTLGSQLLFYLLEGRFSDLKRLYLLVRKKKNATPAERIAKMLSSATVPEFIKQKRALIEEKIEVVDATHMTSPQRFLNPKDSYYFIHSAGYVNLSVDPQSKETIFQENLSVTQRIFEAYAPYLKKFIYISTAFSVGKQQGLLKNNYGAITQKEFRNFYEASKHAAENYLVTEGATRDISIQILRPSVLGGNILDKPIFFISKYMVFYLFAKFFHRHTSSDTIRIHAHADSKLNIIPTDYAAKVITKVFDTDLKELNIVNSKGTNIRNGITKILETVDFKNFKITQEIIDVAHGFESSLEQFYYETIGVHLTPYLTSIPQEWDTSLLESILPLPKYNLEEYLVATVAFAKANGFRNQRW